MKYYHIKTLSYLILFMLVAGSSQASGWKKAVKCADKKAQKKYYAAAADRYECILMHKPCAKDTTWKDSVNSVKIKLANCYMKMENTIKAESNYADVVRSGKADALTTFCYARALEANGKYAEAKDQFDKVADDASVKDKMPKVFSEVAGKAERANYRDKYDIQREAFNTNASEYAPAYYKKGLAFTSNKAERGLALHRIMWNKELFTDIYTVQEDGKGDLNVADKLPAPINSRLNDGAASFNASYDEVFFTRNNKKCKKHDQLQIFRSTFDGTNWSAPKLLNFEMEGASYAHPSLSPDGNTLYFSSNIMGSGYGGMDIYASHRNGNVWETPINLGPTVNTSGNETFPFVAGDSTLYFTSDGWPGYGGMDIFHAKIENGKYGKAHNMGADFNSSKDDLSLIVDSKNHIGYFSSNRDGDDDIFSFKLPFSKKPDKEEKKPIEAMRSGKIVDKTTNEPISGARVEITNPNHPTSGAFYYTNDSGLFYYDKKLNPDDDIKVIKDKYQSQVTRAANVADARAFEVSLEADKKTADVTTQLYSTTLYYDINKSMLTSKLIGQLAQVVTQMKGTKNTVSVSGFADQTGGDTYNYGLSLRRVKEVVDYLTSQGVDSQRIKSAYFGAVMLSSDCAKKPKCVSDTNRENRRVEVKVSNQ